jgi:Flp pilus assembly protein TadD
MCRKLLVAATALSLLAAPAAQAQLFRGKAKTGEKAAAAPAIQSPMAAAAIVQPPRPPKATPEQKALAERSDPVTRSVFWNQQVMADPKDAEAGVKYAASLRALGKPTEAAGAAETVLLYAPDHVDALLEVGRARIQESRAFYGIDFLRRAQTLAPRDWRPLSLLGVAYEQVSRPEDALAAYDEALRLSPENPAVLSNIAMFHAARGDAARAEPLLRRAAVRPGAAREVHLNLAMVLGVQGKLAEAERLLRELLPPDLANNNLAYLQAFHAPSASPAAPAPARTWESLKNGG